MFLESEAAKSVLVTLAFGSGLVPSVMLANRQATQSMFDAVDTALPETTDSPPLKFSPVLFYPTAPRVADVLAVVSRLDAAALKASPAPRTAQPAELKGFMNAPIEQGWTPERPAARTLLRRTEFASKIAALPARGGWPTDADGLAAGGDALRDALGPSSLRGRPLRPEALDAVWVALSGGSSYLAPEELDRQLERWKPSDDVVRLGEFERALLVGRSVIVGGYLILFGLQALVLGTFVVGPLIEAAGS